MTRSNRVILFFIPRKKRSENHPSMKFLRGTGRFFQKAPRIVPAVFSAAILR